jgi:predicted glycosyltransferase
VSEVIHEEQLDPEVCQASIRLGLDALGVGAPELASEGAARQAALIAKLYRSNRALSSAMVV